MTYRDDRPGPRGRLAPDDPRHGTANGYGKFRCRCEPCREAQSEVSRAYRSARVGKEPPEHGTITGYDIYNCRCDDCRVVAVAAKRRNMRNRLPGVPAEHGTEHTYNYYRCRCDDCRAAQNRRISEQRARRKERTGSAR